MTTRSEELIYQEIICHYLPEELPQDNEEFLALLPKLADDSAGRLYSMAMSDRLVQDSNNVEDLIKVLKVVSSDPTHPLLSRIMHSSLLDWEEDPEQNLLQILLRMILAELQTIFSNSRDVDG